MSADCLRGVSKDLAKLGRRLRREGWTVELTGGNHVRWRAPDGWIYFSGYTPSPRATQTAIRDLTRKTDELGS